MPSWAEKLSKSAKFHSENGRFGKAFQKWFFWHRWDNPLEAKFYVILSWRPHLFSPAKKARFDSRARFKPPGLDLSFQGCFYVTERSMQTLQLQLQFSCSIIPPATVIFSWHPWAALRLCKSLTRSRKTGYSQSDSDAQLLQPFMQDKRARCCPRCARGVLRRLADICDKYM